MNTPSITQQWKWTTGAGTLESYLWSNGRFEQTSFYDGVDVSRLKLSLPGDLLTDARGVSVLV